MFALAALGTVPSEEVWILTPVTAPSSLLAAVTAPFLILAVLTAFFFSCLVPTLFFGSICVAAKAVPPPTSRTRQRVETTLAYVRRGWNFFMEFSWEQGRDSTDS